MCGGGGMIQDKETTCTEQGLAHGDLSGGSIECMTLEAPGKACRKR